MRIVEIDTAQVKRWREVEEFAAIGNMPLTEAISILVNHGLCHMEDCC